MACKCGSEKQRSFPSDVKIYLDAGATAAPSAFRLDVLMCLDCGFERVHSSGRLERIAFFPEGSRGIRTLRRQGTSAL